jgi:hypothetical protein
MFLTNSVKEIIDISSFSHQGLQFSLAYQHREPLLEKGRKKKRRRRREGGGKIVHPKLFQITWPL